MRQLNGKRELLHAYLHALFLSDPSAGADFHELQVNQTYYYTDCVMLCQFLWTHSSVSVSFSLSLPSQVGLYADFDPPRLMPFLRQSNFYPLEKALHECEKRDLIPEFVYLLGRAGNVNTKRIIRSDTIPNTHTHTHARRKHQASTVIDHLTNERCDNGN